MNKIQYTIGKVITRIHIFEAPLTTDIETIVNKFISDLEDSKKRYQVDGFQLLKSATSYVGILTIKYMV